MSPVHVIVGTDRRAEEMWAQSFAGGADIYGFDRNVEAFERLMTAEAPIDLVVLTPAQSGPFNLTPDQFLARVLHGSAANTPMLANLHVIVVGSGVEMQHPRVASVRTLAAAIRLVKFGEVEQPPVSSKPYSATSHSTYSESNYSIASEQSQQTSREERDPMSSILEDPITSGGISGGVISRIWGAADSAGTRSPITGGGSAGTTSGSSAPLTSAPVAGARSSINDSSKLFMSPAAQSNRGFMNTNTAASAPVPASMQAQTQGMTMMHEPSPVVQNLVNGQTHGVDLQPARPYTLPNGAGFRGAAGRGGGVMAASHQVAANVHVQQPVPPALVAQIEGMVYPQAQQACDPVLAWSRSAADNVIVPQGVPVPQAPAYSAPAHSAPIQTTPINMNSVPAIAAAPQFAPISQSVPSMPMISQEPPAGVYGDGQPSASQIGPLSNDPFLRRAELNDNPSFG